MRIIKSIIAGLIFSVFIILFISLLISFVYEDEISEVFVEDLNERIDAHISTESINLSLLKKFPGASVALENFHLYTLHETDTSLNFKARHIFFQFNIADIFTGDVNINKIDVNNSYLKLQSDKPIKIKESSGTKKNIKLNLTKLTINNLKYIILNNTKNTELIGSTNKTKISGNISSINKTLSVDSDAFISHLKIKGFPYIQNKNLNFSGNIQDTPELYSFKEGEIELEKLPFKVDGTYSKTDKIVDISLSGKNIRIPELKLHIPWKLRQKLENINLESGNLNLFATIQGKTQNTLPAIEVDFSLSEGKVKLKDNNNLSVRDINFSGYYTNGRLNTPASSFLIFENFSARMNGAEFNGGMELENFLNPLVRISGSSISDLKTVTQIFQLNQFEHVEGLLEANINVETYLNQPLSLPKLIINKKLSGDLTFKNASFQYGHFTVDELSGFTSLDKSVFYFNQMKGTINTTNDINFNGKIENLGHHLKDSTEAVHLSGKLFSTNLNMNAILGKTDTTVAEKETKLPDVIRGNLSVGIENFKWGDFQANSVKGRISYSNKSLSISELYLRTLDGYATLNAELVQHKDQWFTCKTHSFLDNINIYKAFQSFNNFGQEYIQQDNIKGFLSGEIYFSARLDPALNIQTPTISNVSDFTIQNGELIDFKPMKSLSKFINVSELEHIQFSNLKNKITIQDQVIRIPEMAINSSALDLNLEGYHQFNGEYQYHVNLLLSEILSRKADEKVHQFGTVEEDGVGQTRLYLIINGTKGKTEVKYDKERVKERIRQNIQEEKNELKTILNEEFGLFKNDTAIKVEKPKNPKEFKIQWKEQPDTGKQKKKSKKKKTDTEFIIKWEEDTLKKK